MSQRILVVDDEIRRVIQTLLKRAGYITEEASNGSEALVKLQKSTYDLITMDIEMDKLDGIDTISIIRGEINSPIVAISAHLTPGIRADLTERKVNLFLSKPFTTSQLLTVIDRALSTPTR